MSNSRFKSAQDLRGVFKDIPLDRLLVETDAPWLAPTPFRGTKNHPAYVQKTLEKLDNKNYYKIEANELNNVFKNLIKTHLDNLKKQGVQHVVIVGKKEKVLFVCRAGASALQEASSLAISSNLSPLASAYL